MITMITMITRTTTCNNATTAELGTRNKEQRTRTNTISTNSEQSHEQQEQHCHFHSNCHSTSKCSKITTIVQLLPLSCHLSLWRCQLSVVNHAEVIPANSWSLRVGSQHIIDPSKAGSSWSQVIGPDLVVPLLSPFFYPQIGSHFTLW